MTPRPQKRKEFWQRTCRELVGEFGIKSGLSQCENGVLWGRFFVFLLDIVMEEQTKNNKVNKHRKNIKILEISSYNFFLVPVDVSIGIDWTL